LNPSGETAMRKELGRAAWAPLAAGLAGAALLGLGAAFRPDRVLPAYLMAWTFWTGISLGSLALLFLHALSGGRWGFAIRRPLEAAALNLPLTGLLFLPVLAGLHTLYPWSRPGLEDPAILRKAPYLNVPFFVARQCAYFAIWTLLAWRERALSRVLDAESSPAAAGGLTRLGAIGLLVYFVAYTFASVDWLMSLEPRWFSTMFPVRMMIGDALMALALSTIVALRLARRPPMRRLFRKPCLNDMGNLLLAFTILWIYMAFMEFLIIWNGNLPDDNNWYAHRAHGGWQYVPVALVLFHFAAPAAIFLSRSAKRNARVVFAVALGLMLVHLADQFWVVIPSFETARLRIGWQPFAAVVAVGGRWLAG
jgi:hypothetical protein